MQLLLDTHTVIWYAEDDVRLPDHIRQMIRDDYNDVFVSIVSLWEMSIKINLGKLDLSRSFDGMVHLLRDNGFRFLPVQLNHVFSLDTLELHHKDPFDRMLIAQALAEDFAFVGCDDVFDRYGVRRLW
jgi:PIN domain nuclease of toxin-antitoxin system